MKYLILSFLLLGCASKPQPPKLDLRWEFIETPTGTKACLSKQDVLKLNEMRVLKCSEK